MYLKKKQKKKSIKCAYTYWFEYKNFYDVIATLGMYHQFSSLWRIRQPFIPTLTVLSEDRLRFSIFHFYGWVFLPLHLIIWTIVNYISKIIMACKIIYFIWVCCLVRRCNCCWYCYYCGLPFNIILKSFHPLLGWHYMPMKD